MLEGLRPHDSRIFCPPNRVLFNIDKACSALALYQTKQLHFKQVTHSVEEKTKAMQLIQRSVSTDDEKLSLFTC